MASEKSNPKQPLYPQINESNPENPNAHHFSSSSTASASSNLYPKIDMSDLVENLFPDSPNSHFSPSAPMEAVEETLITVPGAIVNLIDKNYSVELACGDLSIIRLHQGDRIVAVLARVSDDIQWPLAKDEAAVKLDDSHYFFSLRIPKECRDSDSSDEDKDGKVKDKKPSSGSSDGAEDVLNYGLTFASKGQENLLHQFDEILKSYSCFSEQRVSEKAIEKGSGLLDEKMDMNMSPADLGNKKKKKMMEERCAAYWTTLAPNVEDYSGSAARYIAAGTGHLIKGILWCGDVTVDRLKWGNEVLKNRLSQKGDAEVDPNTLKRIKRVKRMTKMTDKVANGVLSGVIKVSGLVTSSVANSKVGKKFFGLLPGEIVLASLDGFNKVCDAVEIAGRNIMSTSSDVTTEVVTHRYGEKAGEATNEGLGAAGHAIGTAWAAFKIRKAINPKSALKPTTLAKSAAKAAASEIKAKASKK